VAQRARECGSRRRAEEAAVDRRGPRRQPWPACCASAHDVRGLNASTDTETRVCRRWSGTRPTSRLARTRRSGEFDERDSRPGTATRIYYKDWGTGQPVVFSHGWPLSGDGLRKTRCFILALARLSLHSRQRPARPTGARASLGKANDLKHLRRRSGGAGRGAGSEKTRSTSAIRPVAGRWPATSVATARKRVGQGGAESGR